MEIEGASDAVSRARSSIKREARNRRGRPYARRSCVLVLGETNDGTALLQMTGQVDMAGIVLLKKPMNERQTKSCVAWCRHVSACPPVVSKL